MLNRDRTNHRSQALAALVAFAVVGSAAATGRAQASSGEEVSLYVTVVQGDKLIGGLLQGNFRLYEDGQARDFRLVKPEAPASIALLVEHSRSSYLYFADIQSSVLSFVKQLPEDNWYAFSTFSRDMTVQVDFTKLSGKITDAFAGLPSPLWSEINTYDAVYDTLDALARLPGRRVLIVVGSGMDTFSGRTLDDVRKRLHAANVTVYAVGAGSNLRGRYESYLSSDAQMRLRQSQSFMQMLADESGGEAWFPKFETAFGDVMRGVLQDIAFQYRLVYSRQLPRDGKLHKLKVEAFQIVDDKRVNFKVLSRVGWRL
ncbi:MAG TPA: VWA domain-containing protein [Terriglobia bacterium]|nr:VWA domain-containing protein [Terriglobia bacterium]